MINKCILGINHQQILLCIVSGYLEQGLMVRDSEMLRKHYFKTKAWRYDLVSLLPTDIAYYWWAPGSCDAVSICLQSLNIGLACWFEVMNGVCCELADVMTHNSQCHTWSLCMVEKVPLRHSLTLLLLNCQYWSCSRIVCRALLLCDSIDYFAYLECGSGSIALRLPLATLMPSGYARSNPNFTFNRYWHLTTSYFFN